MAYNNNGGGSFGGRRSGGGGGGFGGRRSFGPRQMHKITCSECGKEDEVPFKPREGSQVFCRDCFAKKNGRTPRSNNSEGSESTNSSEGSMSEE